MAFQFSQPSLNWGASDLYTQLIRFKKHCYFVFNGPLNTATGTQRCGWVVTWIGEKAREVYRTLQIPDDVEDSQVIFQKLEEYIRPRKNKRISRRKLKNRKQASGETFMNFVKDLKVFLMDCEHDDTDDILVDCIIDGVAYSKLQEKLLDRGGDLSLSKAIDIGQQYHESKAQLELMCEEAHVDKVDAIKKRPQPQAKPKRKPEQYHQTNRAQDLEN